MKKGSLWLVSIILVMIGIMVYWDHGFKDFNFDLINFDDSNCILCDSQFNI